MIIPERKKAVSVILAKMSDGGKTHQEVMPESGTNESEQTKINIGNDLLDAIKMNSGKAVAQALEAMVAHIGMQSDDDEGSENE